MQALKWIRAWAIILPFINALLTEAVRTGKNKVGLSVHADTALLLIGQLLHSAWAHVQKRDKVLIILWKGRYRFLRKSHFGMKCLMLDESRWLAIKGSAWEKHPSCYKNAWKFRSPKPSPAPPKDRNSLSYCKISYKIHRLSCLWDM